MILGPTVRNTSSSVDLGSDYHYLCSEDRCGSRLSRTKDADEKIRIPRTLDPRTRGMYISDLISITRGSRRFLLGPTLQRGYSIISLVGWERDVWDSDAMHPHCQQCKN